jgi:cathepsin A (carboxypeptidase C)
MLALFSNTAAAVRLDERVNATGGICDASVKQLSGYVHIDKKDKTNQNYFFWMFESRSKPSTDPFILWLTGGPGCSGQLALLVENGPCHIVKDNATGAPKEVNNPYSWTSNANVLWIDQPTGVGYSYGDKGDYDHDEKGVRDDMYVFLIEFFAAHPEYRDERSNSLSAARAQRRCSCSPRCRYANLPFYVFGESYGGHYAPNVAYRILQGNQQKEAPAINLQGMAVGNGLTDPSIQYKYYGQMAMNNTYGIKTVSEADYAAMQA